MEIIPAKKENLKFAAECLKRGQVLVFPTDTVYGLICDATDEKAVERIFEIKQRDKTKPLGVFIKDMAEVKKIAVINDNQKGFLKDNWPGAVTVILQAKKSPLSGLITQKGTIGLRIPDYRLLALILKEFKGPIAQTSANISGRPATTKIKEVLEQFEAAETQPDVVINAGDLPENKPSKVVDFSENKQKILRY
jgi:L-threonylcarbamoyladenylate synthase